MTSNGFRVDPAAGTASRFYTTHWSVVLAAADTESPEAASAVEELCRTYWYPLYAFVRLKGNPPEDAADLTQAFFERFLERHYVRNFSPEKGRFRTYLLTLLQRFLCDQHDRACAAKRGGGAVFIPLNTADAETGIDRALALRETPEAAFERAWAQAVIRVALERLRAEYEQEAKGPLFAAISPFLARPANHAVYAATAAQLHRSADAVAMAVVRLRKRYRELVRAEVANTVASPAEIDDELRYLVTLLAAGE